MKKKRPKKNECLWTKTGKGKKQNAKKCESRWIEIMMKMAKRRERI